MDLHLQVVLTTSIKRRKPWPRFCWLGLEKESVFLLDDNRISEINMTSGRTKKHVPKLQRLLPGVVVMATSQNGLWLAGLLLSGEMFLWNKDRDCLKTAATVPVVAEMVTAAKESSVCLSLLVSGDGRRALLASLTGQVFLWECTERRGLLGLRDGALKGRWAHILFPETSSMPSLRDKEACLRSVFVQGEALGDCCLCAFTFTSGRQLNVTLLKISWEEGSEQHLSATGYSVRWVTQLYPMSSLSPPCCPVKSRGALVTAVSPDGLVLAVALNQRDPKSTQVLFVSTQNLVSVPSSLGGCGSRNLAIPPKYVRSYWVGDMSWSPGGLFLACVLKRGSLLLLARLGGLLTLSTSGCSVEFGPAHFLPLHPLVTYRPPVPQDSSLSSSCASARDLLRQRYSTTWHPRLPCLIVSDGYTATVLQLPRQPCPTSLISAFLLEVAEALERICSGITGSQGSRQVESMSMLKLLSSLQMVHQGNTSSPSLPHILLESQDAQERWTQGAGEDDSDEDSSQFPGPRVETEGRLEFASMFDTLHAQSNQCQDAEEDQSEDPALLAQLDRAQKNLLTAWVLGVSLGGAVQQRARLLKHAVHCAVRYATLLIICPVSASSRPEDGQEPYASRVLHLFGTLLTLLQWDKPHVGVASCLGVAVELTRQMIRLLLSPLCGRAEPFSRSLSAALQVLRMASQGLDSTYWLSQRSWSTPSEQEGAPVHSVPLSDDFAASLLHEGFPQNAALTGCRPSSRLVSVWQEVYQTALQYQAELHSQKNHSDFEAERGFVTDILSEVQHALQMSGAQLGVGPVLHSIAGEQHFLCGLYAESAQEWAAELSAQQEKAGPRTCFLQTRYCLALLYGLLFQYRLREAQGLCDCLAKQLLCKTGLEVEDKVQTIATGEGLRGQKMLAQMTCEAIYPVLQSMGRFMASYFANQPLVILPPHNVTVLPPLHLPPAPGQRLIVLAQHSVTEALRRQQLSELWTVSYALDLLLLVGLVPEAVWFAQALGDWKTAATLGLAYTSFCKDHVFLMRMKWKELHLPADLQPDHIFQDQLDSLLQSSTHDCMDEEDEVLLYSLVQDLFHASAMAQLDVLSRPLRQLLDCAKELASRLTGLVPRGMYLPAPPLYCPQPAMDTRGHLGNAALVSEQLSRQKVSRVLQRALLLLRAARCSRPSAHWYITKLRRCRRLLKKIRLKGPCPTVKSFPDGLMKFLSRNGFFTPRPREDGLKDSATTETIMCFRELCGLCWMLHVRDQLSVCCRKYQAERNDGRESQVVSCCEEALRWACRLLPFSRFLNAEEVLQDLVLSLVSALPPCPMVAQVLAQAFPEEEESVRVPLREKYNSLLQRLNQCHLPISEQGILDGESKTITVLIQEELHWRRQEQRFITKHLAPLQLHLWEREVEEEEGRVVLNRLSPGTSLSCSTLTDCGSSLMYSDADTADPTFDHLCPDNPGRTMHSMTSVPLEPGKLERTTESHGKLEPRARRQARGTKPTVETPDSLALPFVGTWEFELDDEEYLIFLELFLSYILEKDCMEDDSDLPLLSSFALELHEKELHSLAYEVMTTFRQRWDRNRLALRKGGDAPVVFRPGHCYELISDFLDAPSSPVHSHSQTQSGGEGCSVHYFPGRHRGKTQGLFGCQRHASQVVPPPIQSEQSVSEGCHSQNSMHWTSESGQWLFRTHSDVNALDLCQDLDPQLEAEFQSLSQLLEWMLRWSDRKVLITHPFRKKEITTIGTTGKVFIRAKTSTPAVLTALKLMARRYSATIMVEGRRCTDDKVPVMDSTDASMLLTESKWKPERESSVDTGYPASTVTPLHQPDEDTEHSASSHISVMEKGESKVDLDGEQYASNQYNRDDVTPNLGKAKTFERKERLLQKEELELHIEHLEQEAALGGDSNGSSTELSSSSSTSIPNPNISINISLPGASSPQDQTLSLSDLHSETPGSMKAACRAEESEIPAPPRRPRRTSADTKTSRLAGIEQPPASEPFPSPKPRSLLRAVAQQESPAERSSSSASQQRRAADTQPPVAQLDPVRQLLQDELFRLVQLQQINFMGLMQMVGTSFASMPLVQPNLPHLSQANLPVSQANLPFTQPHPPLLSQTTVPVSQNSLQPSQANMPLLYQPTVPASQTSVPTSEPNLSASQSNLPLSQGNICFYSHNLPPSQFNTHPTQPSLLLLQRPNVPLSETNLTAPQQDIQSAAEAKAVDQQPTKEVQSSGNTTKLMAQHHSLLTLQPDWSHTGQAGQQDFVPSSSGLLGAVGSCSHEVVAGATGLPLAPNSDRLREMPHSTHQETGIPSVSGLRLLQLHPPHLPLLCPPRQGTFPSGFSPSLSWPHCVREAWVQHTEPPTPPPPPPLHGCLVQVQQEAAAPKLYQYTPLDQELQNMQPKSTQSGLETEGARGVSFFPKKNRHPPPKGLPLLRFHPEVRQPPIIFPAAPVTSNLGIQLLQKDHELPRKVQPPTSSSLPTSCLIPLEELTRGQSAGGGPLHLLSADIRTQTTSTAVNSTKRKKRREDKNKEDGSVSVTFRAEESIVPPVEVEEEAQSEPVLDQGGVTSAKLSQPVLSGQDLLTRAWSTAAELHAFASSQKKPPVVRDMCTNTDPACPPSLAEKAISAHLPTSPRFAVRDGERQLEANILPPDIFLDLRFPRDSPSQDSKTLMDPMPEVDAGVLGRGFISVIDLEDGALLQDLPPLQTSPEPLLQKSLSTPTSAQLHLLASTVSTAAPEVLPGPEPSVSKTPPNERAPVELSPPAVLQPVAALSEPLGDGVTVTMLQDRQEQRHIAWGSRFKGQLSARLSEMDAQVEALQRIADHMDQEFASTRMLVRTIDSLAPVTFAPNVDSKQYSSRSVGVEVIDEVSRLCRMSGRAGLLEEEKDEKTEGELIAAALAAVTPSSEGAHSSVSPPSAAASEKLPGLLHSTPDEKLEPTPSEGLQDAATADSVRCGVDSLELTGLSDVADILGQLFQDKILSASELGLSQTQAARLRRKGLQQTQKAQERLEVQAWMKKKQRERLAEYRRQREEKMQQEHKPFKSTATLKPTSKDLALSRKMKEEKDKTSLQEHHSRRAQEACNLMAELLAAPLLLPRTPPATPTLLRPPSTSSSGQPGKLHTAYRSVLSGSRVGQRNRSQSSERTGRSLKLQTGAPRSLSSPGRVLGNQETLSRRLGLHRPAKALPSDRLSQVTRRGMLTKTRSPAGQQGMAKVQRMHAKQPVPVRTGPQEDWSSDVEKMEERDVVSPWDPPSEICQLLGLKKQDWGQDLWEDSREAAGSPPGTELDALSESTGSILSKLDWNAIESMVAGEGRRGV